MAVPCSASWGLMAPERSKIAFTSIKKWPILEQKQTAWYKKWFYGCLDWQAAVDASAAGPLLLFLGGWLKSLPALDRSAVHDLGFLSQSNDPDNTGCSTVKCTNRPSDMQYFSIASNVCLMLVSTVRSFLQGLETFPPNFLDTIFFFSKEI